MCSSYQIKRRINIYRDKIRRVIRLGYLSDEDDDSNNNNEGGWGGWYNDDAVNGEKYDKEVQEEVVDNHGCKEE